MTDKTIKFKIQGDKDSQLKAMLSSVYDALEEKGYNTVSQIVGYILSEEVKNPPANAGDTGDVGSIPGLERVPWSTK